jgi:hypothetical protein
MKHFGWQARRPSAREGNAQLISGPLRASSVAEHGAPQHVLQRNHARCEGSITGRQGTGRSGALSTADIFEDTFRKKSHATKRI